MNILQSLKLIVFSFFLLVVFNNTSQACTPYGTPTVAYNITGTNLNVTVTSTTGWSCCYIYELELICSQANFSGTATHNPGFNLCKSSSANANYQVYSIDISNLCPGQTYKFRVREKVEYYGGWFNASQYSAVQTFTVPGGAPFSVTASANPLQICPPQCTDISAVAQNNCGPVTYSWDQGVGAGANHNVCPAANTTYTVTASSNIPFCPVPLTATDQVTITSAPLAVPGTASLTPSPICEGESTTLSLAGYVGDIQWQSSATPGGPWSNVPGATTDNYNTGPLTTSTYYQAKVYTCDTVYSNEIFVEVVPAPTADFDMNDVCFNEAVIFNDLSSDPVSGIIGWQWDFGDGNTSNQQSPSHTYASDGTYTVTLTVTNPTGCSDVANFDVTVFPLPVADFTFTEVCADQATDLNSTSVVAPPSNIQDYFWDIENNGVVNYNTQNTLHNFNTHGNFSVELVVISNDGCADSIVQNFDVFPLPNVQFTANPLCFGESTSFNDQTNVPLGGNVTDWTWDFGDGNGDVLQNPQHTYGVPNTYSVELSVITDNGCSGSETNTIEIFPLPTADFTVNNECFYDALSFNDQSSLNTNVWEWDFGDGNTSAQQNPSHQYGQAGIYNVELIVTTANGCKDTTNMDVSAYAQPNAEFEIDPVCLNETSLFGDLSTINPVDGDVITNWDWSFGDGNTSAQQNPTNAYAGEGVFNTQLTVTSNYGCEDSYSLDVTVWPLPVVNFTPTDVCLEFNTIFSDLSTVSNQFTNNQIVDWDWDFDDGNTSTQQNPVHAYGAAGTFNATLTTTTNNGCVSSNTLPVTVHPKPVASFTGINLIGCSPLCPEITSTSTVTGTSNITDYVWNFSDGTTINSSGPSIQECFRNTGNQPIYFDLELIVTTNQGCKDTIIENQFIQVNDIPFADFSFTPSNPSIVDPVIETNNQSLNADSYQWSIIGVGTSNSEAPTFTFPTEPETYTISLAAITDQGCVDTATSQVTIYDEVIFYVPNTFTPDNDNFNDFFVPIMTAGYDMYDFNMLIYNRWGEIVFETNNHLIGWDGTFRNKECHDGTYVWQIEFKEVKTDKRHTYRGHVNLLR